MKALDYAIAHKEWEEKEPQAPRLNLGTDSQSEGNAEFIVTCDCNDAELRLISLNKDPMKSSTLCYLTAEQALMLSRFIMENYEREK